MATAPTWNIWRKIQFSAWSCAQDEKPRMSAKTPRPQMICQARVPLASIIRR